MQKLSIGYIASKKIGSEPKTTPHRQFSALPRTIRQIFILMGILAAYTCLNIISAHAQDAPIKTQDLVGEWVGFGYTCESAEPPQTMIIRAVGPKLIATKTRGDNCVPSGHRTWEGTLKGNTITGVYYVSNGPRTEIRTIPATLNVVSLNEIASPTLRTTMRRGDDVAADEVPEDTGKIEVTVINKRTGKPLSLYTVKVFSETNGTEVGSSFLMHDSKGKAVFDAIDEGKYRVELDDRHWSDTSRKAAVSVKGSKTTKVTLNVDFDTVEVNARLSALSSSNQLLPLKDLAVDIMFSDDHVETVKSDKNGRIQFSYNKAPESFRLYTELSATSKYIAVQSELGYDGELVWLITKPVKINTPQESLSVRMVSSESKLSDDMSIEQKFALEHASTYYAHSHRAVDHARDTLNLNLNHNLPVEGILWSPNVPGANYTKSTSTIRLSNLGSKSRRQDSHSPDNREYHEFGHHVMADSAIGGENKYSARGAGEKNHDGVKNETSVDSVVEGFAEFFALWVKGSSVYNFGTSVDLENNLQDRFLRRFDANGSPVLNKFGRQAFERVMDEELQVAALLWDVLDSNADAGDSMDLTDQQMWAVINRVNISDVPSIYRVIKGHFGEKKSNPLAPLGDVDTLFVAHRFFSDTNNNGVWNAGEKIGTADFHHDPASGKIRSQKPSLENSDIQLRSPDGVPDVQWVQQISYYNDGTQADLGTRQIIDGRLTIFVPENAEYLEIRPIISGFNIEPVRITPEAYLEGLGEALYNGDGILQTVDLAVAPSALEAPTNPIAHLDFDGLWIGWSGLQTRYVLVEGAGHSPETLHDGTVLYEGRDSFFQISDVLDKQEIRYFSVFAMDDAGSVSIPLQFTYPQDIQGSDGENEDTGISFIQKLILLLIALILIVFAFVRRRRKKKGG